MSDQAPWEQDVERLLDQPFHFTLVLVLLGFLFLFVPLLIFFTTAEFSPRSAISQGYLGSWTRGLYFLVAGPSIIDGAYKEAGSKPFMVSTPFNKLVLVSSEKHVWELATAQEDQLSLHAVAKDALQPRYTMHGFQWQDQRGIEGTGFVRALRSLLTSNLSTLLPELQSAMRSTLDTEIGLNASSTGTSVVPLFALVKEVVVAMNCVTFFGKDFARNREFRDAALGFPQDAFVVGELLNLFPAFLKPSVAYIATRGHRAAKTLVSYLRPLVEQRLELRALNEKSEKASGPKPVDCMQWLIDTSPRKNPWTAERMMGEIMGVWFGAVHQLAMTTTFALEQLCQHPEYIQPLREEIERAAVTQSKCGDVEKLPLLNSFVMETARFETTEAITCRRKALVPFQYSDGTKVEVGNWTCLPQKAIMQDALHYPNPMAFDGFRFAKKEDLAREEESQNRGSSGQETSARLQPNRFTDVNALWPIWGIGKPACPGRFYASVVLKLILVDMLQTYDFELEEPNAPRTASWRTTIVPRSSVKIILRQRDLLDRDASTT